MTAIVDVEDWNLTKATVLYDFGVTLPTHCVLRCDDVFIAGDPKLSKPSVNDASTADVEPFS